MDVASMAQMAMVMQKAQLSQDMSMEIVKQSLQQDAAVLQIISAAAPPQVTVPAPSGTDVGATLNISV